MMRADRIFFSGGEATIHLPYIEKVVEEARKIEPNIKVNFSSSYKSVNLNSVLGSTWVFLKRGPKTFFRGFFVNNFAEFRLESG